MFEEQQDELKLSLDSIAITATGIRQCKEKHSCRSDTPFLFRSSDDEVNQMMIDMVKQVP